MSQVPTQPSWPNTGITFQDLYQALQEVKAGTWPRHTARDLRDPVNLLLQLAAALGDYSLGHLNNALLQLQPLQATSRKALLAQLGLVSRGLQPALPASGYLIAQYTGALTAEATLLDGLLVSSTSARDPMFLQDSPLVAGSSVTLSLWFDSGSGEPIAESLPVTRFLSPGASWIIGRQVVAFSGLTCDLSTVLGGPMLWSLEATNEEYGAPSSVTDQGDTLRFGLDDYLTTREATGLQVIIRHKASGLTETVTVAKDTENYVETGLFAQDTPNTATTAYEVLASWRPVPSWQDGTESGTTDGTITWDDLFTTAWWWAEHSVYGYAVRLRVVSDPDNHEGNHGFTSITPVTQLVVLHMTQGERPLSSLGQADGTAFQLLPLPTAPLLELVSDPRYDLLVDDVTWTVRDDLSDTGPEDRHATLVEDVDSGWCLMFGDGILGQLPASGASVSLRYRTGSVVSGNLEAGTEFQLINGPSTVQDVRIPRGTTGYVPREADTRAEVIRLRNKLLPQLALRTESVVTRQEILAALTAVDPRRATFQTSDGRQPFARGAVTVDSTVTRQYRVALVGTAVDGAVSDSDLVEAAAWLNGTQVGIQMINGHAGLNTQATVVGFTPRVVLPWITVKIVQKTGVRGLVDKVLRALLQPNATDASGAYAWDFGGRVPVPVFFGAVWAAVPGRYFIEVTLESESISYDGQEAISLAATELPVLSADYDPTVHITVEDP